MRAIGQSHMRALVGAVAAVCAAQLCGSVRASSQCASDAELARIASDAKRHLERQPLRYSVAAGGLDGLPFDFSFAPANYTTAGVNPSSRYIVPRLGPWREGDLGGDSFLKCVPQHRRCFHSAATN